MLKIFNLLRLILYFLGLLGLIIHELGQGAKEIKKQPWLKNFKPNLIFDL